VTDRKPAVELLDKIVEEELNKIKLGNLEHNT
jgi:hypothetical protein